MKSKIWFVNRMTGRVYFRMAVLNGYCATVADTDGFWKFYGGFYNTKKEAEKEQREFNRWEIQRCRETISRLESAGR